MTDNEITREKTFSEELPYFNERIKEVFDNYDNPNGYEDPLYIAVLRDSHRIVRKAEEEINRQKAEYNNLLGQFRSLDCECERLEKADENQKAEIERLSALVKSKNILIEGLDQSVSYAYDRAIKEFAERLKEKSFKTIRNYGLTKDVVEVCDIDNLVKEMVGE